MAGIKKLFIFTFIPFYLAVIYFLYNHLTQEITKLKEEREAMLNTKQLLLENMVSMATEISNKVLPKKVVKVSPYIRLAEKLTKLNQEIINVDLSMSDLISEQGDEKFIEELRSIIPKQYTEKEVQSLYKEFISKNVNSKPEVDENGNGPTKDAQINNEIKLSEEIKSKVDFVLTEKRKEYKKIKEDYHAHIKVYESEYKPEFDKYADKQWKLIEKAGKISNTLRLIEEKLQSLKDNYLIKTDKAILSQSIDNLRTDELERIIKLEIDKLESSYNEIDASKEFIKKSNMINFAYEADYKFLSEYFKSEFSYKRLISNHDVITKDYYIKQISGKSDLLFYIELESKRRIAFFTKKQYPKKTLIPKEYKDDNSFIAFLNKKELYLADPSKGSHYKTDPEFLFIVGNTLNDDGFWAKLPDENVNQGKPVMTIGIRSPLFTLGKGSLFSQINHDSIVSFEVFQLAFNN